MARLASDSNSFLPKFQLDLPETLGGSFSDITSGDISRDAPQSPIVKEAEPVLTKKQATDLRKSGQLNAGKQSNMHC
ncbi:hypothetical protein KBI23_17625 [bacterium]|nr:hypothetical protein [bacterium]